MHEVVYTEPMKYPHADYMCLLRYTRGESGDRYELNVTNRTIVHVIESLMSDQEGSIADIPSQSQLISITHARS